jgi:hypothetical protein
MRNRGLSAFANRRAESNLDCMNTNNDEFEKEVNELRGQWGFVLVAAFLAIFIGIAVNAAYEILREHYSVIYILVLGTVCSALLIDALTYLLATLHYMRDHPEEKYPGFLKRYLKMRLKSIKFWER